MLQCILMLPYTWVIWFFIHTYLYTYNNYWQINSAFSLPWQFDNNDLELFIISHFLPTTLCFLKKWMQYPSVDNSPFNVGVKYVRFCMPQRNKKNLVSRKQIKITLKPRDGLGSWDIRTLKFFRRTFICWVTCTSLFVTHVPTLCQDKEPWSRILPADHPQADKTLTEGTFSLIQIPYIKHYSWHKGILCPVQDNYCG